MTATTIRQRKNKKKHQRQIITNEVIYSWMANYGIPFDCDKWHLNRLIMLVSVCGENNQPPEKMSKKETTDYYKALNARNRERFHSKG